MWDMWDMWDRMYDTMWDMVMEGELIDRDTPSDRRIANVGGGWGILLI